MIVQEYDTGAGNFNGYRQVGFYFYGKRNTYKAVLNFTKRTVRIAVRVMDFGGPQWLTVKEWQIPA